MKIAIVAISGEDVMGQSLGCVIPYNPKTKLSSIRKTVQNLKALDPEGRVETFANSSIAEIEGRCLLSIGFHLPGPGFLLHETMVERARRLAGWIRKGFDVDRVDFVEYKTRVELAHHLCLGKTPIM
ncbi:MAG: hypothetical protein A2648_02325 [Candidatus Lloydbacteria bacterium RIFCSPHIGHO2_01_FULL_41_20]|uniref:Uncharacterized protein n=1 Tax=Candidatus Lloydbacteria bacterium RIFCSPHIGHO2_01_FULL_41_20 TaxID=1798657 RepID=A0A1G2CR91_9BACT|nr:MAG: hypothetical protein A2648_02325 [Candidatus Lloydbacteria bacterium RIFCSPHIGHO2_01_FULL_41_20]